MCQFINRTILILINTMDLPDSQVQSTAHFWPNSAQLRQKLSFPLALTFSPGAQENNNASFNDKNLDKYRCQSCKAFINKFCLIRCESKKIFYMRDQYDCSLCGFSNHIDQKLDINSPQLTQTSYKCKASKVQRTIMSKDRLFVFILDFSNYSEFSQKFLFYSIHAIRQFVTNALQLKNNIKIMFLLFDDGIQTFNIKNEIKRVIYWDDDASSTVSDYPFSSQQICLLPECKDNVCLILDTLEQEVNLRQFRSNTQSLKIMEVVQYALRHTITQSGKIFIISGLNHQLQKFKVMRNYDSTVQDAYKHHFATVKKQCLTETIQNMLISTQMSVSYFIHKNMYSNLMPLHIITKSTNGDLRQYMRQQNDHFFYEFNFMLHQCLYEMKFQTLMRVRAGIGLKLVGIFGNYRPWKGISDQVQMLSCQNSRKYTFEFIIQGKVNSPWTLVQFSVLYTDLKGNRYSRVVTHRIELSSQMGVILPEINYQMVNFTYLKAILHNMDLTPYYRKLQLALQERCKRHVKMLRDESLSMLEQNSSSNCDLMSEKYMKKARNYVILTYMLMKHFLLNLHERRDIYLDSNIEIRSKLNAFQDYFKIVWPILYVIDSKEVKIVEMKTQNFTQESIGVVIDRGDHVYVFIKNQTLRSSLRLAKDPKSAIKDCSELQKISTLLEEIQDKKPFPHLNILLLEPNFLFNFNIFSLTGSHSFETFIQTLLQN